MSLVPNSQSSDLRIYQPSCIPGVPQPEELSKSTAQVLHKIHCSYRNARKLLETWGGEAPAACSTLCLGLLDPVSNLLINNLIPYKRNRKRAREPSRVEGEEEEEDLERRSLDGMVTFLTRLFPDLAESQAMRYLFLADADAVVAAGIIVSDVGMKRFFDSGPAIMEMALLKCAALAAGHPDPDRLVSAWRNISSHIDDVLPLLTRLSLICPESSSGERRALLPIPLTGYAPLSGYRHAQLAYVHTAISEKVNALLNAYEQMPTGDAKFELHTIFGVNDRVPCRASGPPRGYHNSHGYHDSHVNFMATPKSPCGGGVPTLFFAEIIYGYKDRSFCCPLPLPLPCDGML